LFWQLAFSICHLGYRAVLRGHSDPSLLDFFSRLEARMSKSKVLFIFCMVVLFAVVAVFSNLSHAGTLQGGKLMGGTPAASPIEILTADGGDPQPPPRPMPWLA